MNRRPGTSDRLQKAGTSSRPMGRACRPLVPLVVVGVMSSLATSAVPVQALEIWSGRTFAFVKGDNVDWNLAGNQDRITPNVWLTRKNSQGIFNINQELGYGPSSPKDTEWATGDAVNHASLVFKPWVDWAANNPPGTVGVNAVVHLISEDIYIDIRFDSWTGFAGGGGFSYHRGEPSTTSVGPGTAAFSLRGFLDNPARGITQIEFTLPDAAPARLEVFDLAGRMIARQEVGSLGAGTHRVRPPELGATAAGVLFVRLVREGRSLAARGVRLQ